MFISREREKLLHAIIYFARMTKHCHTLKLFKLLNLLDFEHYRQTGRTVTGLQYHAFSNGPVPAELWEEIKHGGNADLKAAITIKNYRDQITSELTRRDITPRIAFDKRLFSQREMRIMNRIVEFFRDSSGADMSEFSHLNGLPWRNVFGNGEGNGRVIDPEMSLKSAALVTDAPTIARDELEYRRELLKGVP
jgi:uncharacterized phage-associated protein